MMKNENESIKGMNKIFLTLDEMQNLKDMGIKLLLTSYMYIKFEDDDNWKIQNSDNLQIIGIGCEYIPAYNIQDLICLLPPYLRLDNKGYYLNIRKRPFDWIVSYNSCPSNIKDDYIIAENKGELIDALYQMVVRLAISGYIETTRISFDIEKAKSGKAVRTRNGMEVRILCYNRENRDKKCIVALIKNKNGNEQVQNYYADGTGSSVGRRYDLCITDENG